MDNSEVQYNKAKSWQIPCFALLDGAGNLFVVLMTFAMYIASGGYGIAVVLASTILTGTRILDAVTDPILGFLTDRMNSRFGKFRPLLILAQLLMALSVCTMFFWGLGKGTMMFVGCYVVYILGYTLSTIVRTAVKPSMTNDPKQRPLFGRWGAVYTLVFSSMLSYYNSAVLAPKHGGINMGLLQELCILVCIVTTICTVIGLIAIWDKDKPEQHNTLIQSNPVKLKDCWGIIKDNRALQMLIVAASTDKLALQIGSNSTINMLIFGVIMGNYAFSGKLSIINLIPSLILVFLGSKIAGKTGSKKELVRWTWISIGVSCAMLGVFLIFDPTQISVAIIPTIAFIVVNAIRSGVIQVLAACTVSMVVDCTDYERYRSGKNMPGTVGTIFSFVDKFISSFATTIIGVFVAMVGYTSTMPQQGDVVTAGIFWVGMFLYLGIPLIAWISTLIAMKFYPLDADKMVEIQTELYRRSENTKTTDIKTA